MKKNNFYLVGSIKVNEPKKRDRKNGGYKELEKQTKKMLYLITKNEEKNQGSDQDEEIKATGADFFRYLNKLAGGALNESEVIKNFVSAAIIRSSLVFCHGEKLTIEQWEQLPIEQRDEISLNFIPYFVIPKITGVEFAESSFEA